MTDEQKARMQADIEWFLETCRLGDGTYDVSRFKRMAAIAGYEVVQEGTKVELRLPEAKSN